MKLSHPGSGFRGGADKISGLQRSSRGFGENFRIFVPFRRRRISELVGRSRHVPLGVRSGSKLVIPRYWRKRRAKRVVRRKMGIFAVFHGRMAS